jgi:hypothetical protein
MADSFAVNHRQSWLAPAFGFVNGGIAWDQPAAHFSTDLLPQRKIARNGRRAIVTCLPLTTGSGIVKRPRLFAMTPPFPAK